MKSSMSDLIGSWIKAQHLENGGRHGVIFAFDEKRQQFAAVLDCQLNREGTGFGDTPEEALQNAVLDHAKIIREAKEEKHADYETDRGLN